MSKEQEKTYLWGGGRKKQIWIFVLGIFVPTGRKDAEQKQKIGIKFIRDVVIIL